MSTAEQPRAVVLYSDDFIVAINKPPGLNVHEAPGTGSSVLRELGSQPGLKDLTPVHRLDKDASGVLLFARSTAIAAELQRVWSEVEKSYLALCDGIPAQAAGVVDAPLLENQTGKPERLRNAVRYFQKMNPGVEVPPLPAPKTSAVHLAGRPAQTEYRVAEQFPSPLAGEGRDERSESGVRGKGFSLLEVRPRQGRMHQVRVHLAHLGNPLAVDSLYGKRATLLRKDVLGEGEEVLLARMPLHAAKLTFTFRGERLTLDAPLPADIEAALALLRSGTRL